MIEASFSFFSTRLQCLRRTKEQRVFEQELYTKGLAEEQKRMIQEINETISSKEFAVKFILQELDVARQGDTFIQYFVEKSGFHISEYSGALEKFQQEQEEIEKVQALLLNFLNKISDEKIMYQTAMTILNGVMEHWEIGKYSEEGEVFSKEEQVEPERPVQKRMTISSLKLHIKKIKTVVMEKLVYFDKKIQNVLDTFAKPKEEKTMIEPKLFESNFETKIEKKEPVVKLYTDDKVDALMEQYSHVIEDIITGEINIENHKEIKEFQEEMSLATLEGNNLASVFCAFFQAEASFSELPLPITNMDDKSKMFFIEILNTFEEKGFSDNLHEYLEENREIVYALATKNDMFMQYLIAFWYALENEDEAEVLKEQAFWYRESASNGFEPAIERLDDEMDLEKENA